jgi:biotin transport system substrate-specific component
MLSQRNETLPTLLTERFSTVHPAVRNGGLVVAGSLVIALSAQIAVPLPFTPVPMTMQPLAVLLVGAALGSARGFAAALLYLLQGIAGLPVFAHGLAGPAVLFGSTGGFLLAFPLAAGVTGWLSEKGGTRTVPLTIASMTLGLAVLYLGGWVWLSAGWKLGPVAAFTFGVAPFLLADLVKVGLGALLLPAARAFLRR